MSVVNFEIFPSQAVTASVVGGAIDTSGIKEMEVFVELTTGSGTLTKFSAFLEGSSDGGTTWFELLYDTSVKNSSGAVPADEPTVTVTKRNIISEGAAVTAATKWTAQYTRFPDKVRARVIITPTAAPSETFSMKAVGKN